MVLNLFLPSVTIKHHSIFWYILNANDMIWREWLVYNTSLTTQLNSSRLNRMAGTTSCQLSKRSVVVSSTMHVTCQDPPQSWLMSRFHLSPASRQDPPQSCLTSKPTWRSNSFMFHVKIHLISAEANTALEVLPPQQSHDTRTRSECDISRTQSNIHHTDRNNTVRNLKKSN